MRAADIMTKGAVTIADTATVIQAAELMVNTRVSGLPVLDDRGALVGMLSEADLIGRAEIGTPDGADALLQQIANEVSEADAYVKAHSRLVRDVMTTNVVTVSENATLAEVARVMLQRRVKRLPVMRASQIVGVVSRINLVQALIARAGAPGRPPPASAPPAAPPGDAELLADVEGAIRAHRWTSARMEATVLHGVAHIWGVVADDSIRKAYLIAVEKVPGIKDVVDHTHVIEPLLGSRRSIW